LHAGGVIAYPTEAVYGIGCLPHESHALARILAMKRRSASKGFILIAADLAQVEAFAELPKGEPGRDVAASWPGPVTWVLQARPSVPTIVTGSRDTVAIRVTAHPVARALCVAAGSALVSTSANVSGRNPITHRLKLRRQLGRALDMIVPGELGERRKPTEIRDGSTGAVIRAD
jgi:L-threonylcarbamoyladenylate synthase